MQVQKTGPTLLTTLKRKSGGFLRRLFFGSATQAPRAERETGATNGKHVNGTNGRNGHGTAMGPTPRSNGASPPTRNGQIEQQFLLDNLTCRFRRSWYARIKIALDFLMALTILAVSAPVVLLAMLLVKLTSRGPALYTQTRVGLDGRPFTIYKLRSMTYQCESLTGARWCTPNDSRVTPLGRLLRKTHIDELPQLWNVLRGEMSLIGPRPERPEFVPQLEIAIPLYRTRLQVRPGLTGLAQVQLPPDTNLDSVRLKLAYDVWYIRHVNFFMDLRILFGTAAKLVGLPFAAIRSILGFARRERVVPAYEELAALVKSNKAHAQTA
jgi:lipopolysaccharide/colanic/teichoic acid biosynthesis glycosyltransferase